MPNTPSDVVKGVMPSYQGFLAIRLNEIWAAWDDGQPEKALVRACRLVNFLPRALKKLLQTDREEIQTALTHAYQQQGVDFYTTQQRRNKAARHVALTYLEPFVTEITDELDKRGYFETPSIRPRETMGKKLTTHS